jgi:hypothetical protein
MPPPTTPGPRWSFRSEPGSCCAGSAWWTRALAAAREPPPEIDAVEPLTVEPLSFSSIGWMFALIAFLYAFGFVVGPALYLFAFLRVNGFAWSTATTIGLASVAVTWGFFIKTIGILLPVAPLWM